MAKLTQSITYTIEELRAMVIRVNRSSGEKSKPITFFNEKPVHEITDLNILPGEVFREGTTNHNNYSFEVKVSNFGRVIYKGEVITQREKDDESDGYLVLDKAESGLTGKLVYQIVADVWLDKPSDRDVKIRHHITNNGYDNRPENLMWVTAEEDKLIHAGANW